MARASAIRTLFIVGAVAVLNTVSLSAYAVPGYAAGPGTIVGAAATAQQRFGVPAPLLEAICYLEGHLSDHDGAPSAAGGYGCMNLARNSHLDTLDQAAKLLGAPVSSVRNNQTLNIAGAAAVLRADALSLSSSHKVPITLGGWYGAIAKYSGARHDVATMYADEVYRIIRTGLSAIAPTGEIVRIAPTAVTPDTATASTVGERAGLTNQLQHQQRYRLPVRVQLHRADQLCRRHVQHRQPAQRPAAARRHRA